MAISGCIGRNRQARYRPWQTKSWFVSPWNYAENVTNSYSFPKQIRVHDVTLRDGEQQAGIVFTRHDKIRIAEGLAEAGIHRIEAGMPAVSSEDAAAIREIVKLNLGPQIFAFSRCMVDDVKRAVDCGVSGVVMEIPASSHIIEHAYRWPLEKAIETSIESTAYAHDQGLEVVFFPIDFTRADLGWVLDLVGQVSRGGHMDALALADTFGVCSPHAIKHLVREVRKSIDKRLEAHFHMDFGLGVANTILALAEGVEVMHTTVLGLGERAGNVPLEETAVALLTMYGIDLGIRYDKLCDLARTVEVLSGQVLATNRPVVGKCLFMVESGIISSWLRNCGDEHLTELFPYRPDLVGHSAPEVVMGKGSGLDSVRMWLERLQIQTDPATEERILDIVKNEAVCRKRLLSLEEFSEIVARILPRPEDGPAIGVGNS